MKRYLHSLIVLALLNFITGCIQTTEQQLFESGKQPLNNHEIKTLFSKTRNAHWNGDDGRNASITFSPHGSQKIVFEGGADEGSYFIENNRLCGRWRKIDNGSIRCHTIFKTGEKQYRLLNNDGSSRGLLTF